ncbi:MAG: hypothetical protein KDG55_15350 [Rhodocyclaceae bacterium]|nr:hypothetical protein [Rhodocyclaceae bacterium]
MNQLLERCDSLAREHCGMPIDLMRLVSNTAYRESVFSVLERSRHHDLRATVAGLRAGLARG